MLKKIYLLSIIVLQFNLVFAQVSTNFNSEEILTEKGKFNFLYYPNILELSAPDLSSATEKENAQLSKGSKIFQFAQSIETDIDLVNQTSWINDADFYYGKFTIKSKDAKSLSARFSNFFLPEGTEMYVYNKNGGMITGIVTAKENNVNKSWGSSVYQGDELNIEIKVPQKFKELLTLQIKSVAYGYKYIFAQKIGGFGASGPCQINVLCPQGNNWVGERNSVVHILLAEQTVFASGSILMNTCGTNIPYILTANHVYLRDNNVTNWQFFFQAWSNTCTPNTNVSGLKFEGATLKANWEPSDFCLVQLNQTPSSTPLILASVFIYYSGWSRSTATPNSIVGIHHPSGDVMKISSSSLPVFRSNNTTWTSPGSPTITVPGSLHWRVLWPSGANGIPTSGVTEGGSSGSPLYDQNHRVVGQLAGGPSNCSSTSIKQDAYGRFDDSWTGGGTPASRLSDWLDPYNTGALTTNLTSIFNLTPFNSSLSLSISGDNAVCTTSGNYSVSNLPAGFTVQWSALPAGIVTINSPNSTQTTLTKISDGTFTLTATVTNCQGSVSLSKTLGAGVPIFRGWYNSKNNPQEPLNPWNKNSQFTNLVCYGTFITTTTDITANASVLWQPSGTIPTGMQWSQIGNNLRFVLTDINQDAYFVVTITNACGTKNIRYKFTSTADNCPGANPLKAQISPNPASNVVNISLIDNADISIQKEITEIRLMDKMGSLKQKWNYEKGNAIKTRQINVSSIPADVYMIMIFDGSNWISEKFIKQ